jgi:hypothetical protein
MKKLFIFLPFVLLVACKKDSVATDTQAPTVTISSPGWAESFPGGQIVKVIATITDNDILQEVHFEVTNKATSEEIVHLHHLTTNKTYNLSDSFTVVSGITYHIEVEGDDRSGNAAKSELEVSGN